MYLDYRTTEKVLVLNYGLIFCIALFLIKENIRGILGDGLASINLLFALLMTILIYKSIKSKLYNTLILYIVFCISSIILVNGTVGLHYSVSYILLTIVGVVFPFVLVAISISKEETILYFKNFLKLFNMIVILLVFFGVIDFLTNGLIQVKLAGTWFKNSEISELIYMERSWGVYRYYSILGHPLTNAKYFLFFLVLNNVYAIKAKPILNKYIVIFISILGLLLSGSKTAIILGLVVLIFSNIKSRKGLMALLFLACILCVLYNTDLFQENLKQRFLEGIVSGDITSGRNSLLSLMLANPDQFPNLLGGGAGYSREVAQSFRGNIFNFEYPIVMLAYDYGIICTILIYICIFIYPCYVFLKNKDFQMLFYFLILSAMVNSNNGLANLGSDSLAQFCFLIFIMQGISGNKNLIVDK